MSDNPTQPMPAPQGEPYIPPPARQPITGLVDAPPSKQKMSRGKKAGLWTGGVVVAFIAIGAT